MSKKIIIIVTIIFVVLAAFFTLKKFADARIEKEGNAIVAKIENFKTSNGRLPESLSEIGVEETESGPWFYSMKDGNYTVYYPLGFDESKTYDSSTREWQD